MRKPKIEYERKYRASEKGKACTKRYNDSPSREYCEKKFLEKIMNTPELRERRITRVKAWRQNNQGGTYAKVRKEVLSFLGNKCVRCGIDDFRVLQIDHVNGNGYRERQDFGKGGNASVKYYRHILEVRGEGYQLLCANCNWIKRYERQEYN